MRKASNLVKNRKTLETMWLHVVAEVSKPNLSVSYFCRNGIETHLARQTFLQYGEKHERLIKESGGYIVKAQIVHEVKGAVEAPMQDGGSQSSCVEAEGLQKFLTFTMVMRTS